MTRQEMIDSVTPEMIAEARTRYVADCNWNMVTVCDSARDGREFEIITLALNLGMKGDEDGS